jgi:hypothetical protein
VTSQRKQGNSVHKRLQNIDADIKRLQQVRAEIAAQEENAQQELDRAATGFAKISAAHLASVVLSKLPRELRDMVYMHLVESPRENGPTIVVRSDGLISRNGAILGSCPPYSRNHTPRAFPDPELFGAQLAAEVAEDLFRNVEFKVEDVRLLKQFIDYDVFKAGRAPRDNFYCLDVTVSSSLRRDYTYTTIAGELNVLLQVAWPAAAVLRLLIEADDHLAFIIEQNLVPFIYIAKDMGLRVEVIHTLGTYNFRFDRSREEWNAIFRVEEELSDVSTYTQMQQRDLTNEQQDEDLGPGLFD